jgi:hypothetical protein
MSTRTHFAHRIDMWDDDGETIVEHLAGVEDFQVALATFRANAGRMLASPCARASGSLRIAGNGGLPDT